MSWASFVISWCKKLSVRTVMWGRKKSRLFQKPISKSNLQDYRTVYANSWVCKLRMDQTESDILLFLGFRGKDIILQFEKQYLHWRLMQAYLLIVIYHSFIRHKIIHRKSDLNCLLNCCLIFQIKAVQSRSHLSQNIKQFLHSIFLTTNTYEKYQPEKSTMHVT